MSGCRWRSRLAIGGLVLLLASPLFAQESPERPAEGPPPVEEGQRAAPNTSTPQDEAGQGPANEQSQSPEPVDQPSTIEGQQATEETAEPEQDAIFRAEQRADDDLSAQWWMARAGIAVAVVAALQVILTIIGIVLIWRTLAASRDAVTEASNATRAAEAVVRVTSDTAERQLRAYVALDNKSFHVSGEAPVSGPIVRASVVNMGQTPAYDLRHWMGIGLYEVPLARTLTEGTFSSMLTLGPSGSIDIEITKKVAPTPEQIVALKSGKGGFYVWGRIEYRDVFDKSQFVNFRFVSIGMHKEGGSFMRLPTGNDAS